jgi:hypothetical protein
MGRPTFLVTSHHLRAGAEEGTNSYHYISKMINYHMFYCSEEEEEAEPPSVPQTWETSQSSHISWPCLPGCGPGVLDVHPVTRYTPCAARQASSNAPILPGTKRPFCARSGDDEGY